MSVLWTPCREVAMPADLLLPLPGQASVAAHLASAQNATLMYIQDGRYSEITLLSAHRSKYKVSFRVARALSSSLSYIACADNVSVASRLTKLCVIGAVDQSPSEQSTVATLRLHCKSSSGVWFWYAARLLCLLLSIIEPAAFGSTDGQSNRPRTVRSTSLPQLSCYSWLHGDILQHGLPASWAEIPSIR